MSKTEPSKISKHRDIEGFVRWICIFFASVAIIVAVIFNFQISHIPVAFTGHGYYYLLLMLYLPMVFIFFPATKRSSRNRIPWYDFLLALLSLVISIFFMTHSLQILNEGWEVKAPFAANLSSLLLILLVLDAARRTAGIPFFMVCLFFGAYPLFSKYMPSFLMGNSFNFWRTVSFHAMSDSSIVGLPLQVVGNILIGFMIFAVSLQYTGAGPFFINLAMAIFGHVRGGAAKVSIVSSGFMGSLSGSVIANILTTGSFTIPAMKKTGFSPSYAAAVEACASTGGVLMPPIMGATAFVMAELLNIPYGKVIIAAAIPSALYYMGLYFQIDAHSAKVGLKGLPRSECPNLSKVLKEGWMYMLSFFLLLYVALWLWREAEAPWIALGALLVMTMIKKETRLTFRGLMNFIEATGRFMAELTAILASVGLIVGSLMVTGVAHSFSYEVMALAGKNVVLLLSLGAITSLILGMGMTITACYLFLALVMAPVMVDLGYYALAVHLFLLYWGDVSFITPPVALGSFAAASLAGAPFFETGWQAVKLGIYKYFLPFFFVLNPSLVCHGSITDIIYAFFTCSLGIWLISNGAVGYMQGIGRVDLPWERAGLFISGFLIAMPEYRTDIIGFFLFMALFAIIYFKKRRSMTK